MSFNGYLYRCSPEALRPLAEDEAEFRELNKDLSFGKLVPELEDADKPLAATGHFGQYQDLTKDVPGPEDFELEEDVEAEPSPMPIDDRPSSEGGPRKIAGPRILEKKSSRRTSQWSFARR